MTKNEILISVFDDYLKTLVINKFEDVENIESVLLPLINDEIESQNSIKTKGRKIQCLDHLPFWQIANLINHIFTVKMIRLVPTDNDNESSILGIYVDDLITHLLCDDSRKGLYIVGTDAESLIKKVAIRISVSITQSEQYEIVERIKSICGNDAKCEDRDLIAVNNGIFHYDTKELADFSPEYVFLTKSCVDYNPNATSPVIKMPNGNNWEVEAWMNELNDDPEITNLFWEITSALLRPNVRWNKAAMLMSNTGNNGKGTLVEMWRSLLGSKAHCSIPLCDFNKKFALTPLLRASAIITDENDVGSYIDKAGVLKAIITNDVVTIEKKFNDPVSYRVHGFMVQCLNDLPRTKDKSESYFRRQLFIPMTKCFTGMEIPEIKNDYLHRKEVLEYVMKKALETNFYKLSEPASCKLALEGYKEFNDPVRQFWGEFKDEFKWNLLPFQFLYDLFVSWFRKNSPSGTVPGNNVFKDDLLSLIANDTEWNCDDPRKKIRVSKKSNMDEPEPLILEYGLDDWKNKVYRGSNKLMLAKIDPADSYRGLVRLDTYNKATNDADDNNI